jgi:transposase
MIFPSNVPVYFCVVPIDMRRSFDSLSEIVRESLGQEPRSGHLFVFRNKPEDCVKVLYWDRNGYAIWYKRLEKGTFRLPSAAGASLEITSSEFTMLLEGFDLMKLQRQNRWSRQPAGV